MFSLVPSWVSLVDSEVYDVGLRPVNGLLSMSACVL